MRRLDARHRYFQRLLYRRRKSTSHRKSATPRPVPDVACHGPYTRLMGATGISHSDAGAQPCWIVRGPERAWP
jgi:hypothetical protein